MEGNPTADKIEFTPEQQEYINNTLIKDAMGRAGKEARTKAAELETKLTEAQDAITSLTKELDALRKKGQGSSEAADDVKALRAEFEQIAAGLKAEAETLRREAQAKASDAEKARKELMGERKRHQIMSAASKVGFHNLDAVIKLTEDSIEWDEEKRKYIVRGDNGEIRHNSAMQYMSLDEFYTDYAAKNPWLATGQMKGGAGSEQSTQSGRGQKYSVEEIFGPKSSALKATKLKRENPQEYARLKKIAQEANIIA